MAGTGIVSKRADSLTRFESFDAWLAALTQPSALTELAAMVGCMLLAWLVVRLVSRARVVVDESSILFGRRVIDGVLFPLLLLLLAYVVQGLLARVFPLAVFKVAIPV